MATSSTGGAVSTVGFHVSRALDFYNKNTLWFALGKEVPWEGGVIPEPVSDSVLENPWGFKKVEAKYMVKPDPNGNINYLNSRWSVVQPDRAYEENARWVYMTSYVYYDELPFKTYHQVGLQSNLVPKEDVPPGKINLTLEEVENIGILEILDNRPGVSRAPDMREQLGIIVEF